MNQVAGTRSDQEFEQTISALRDQVANTLAAIDELERRYVMPTDEIAAPSMRASVDQGQTPVRTDVIIHHITSPALARTAQQHLAHQNGITQATVRELAEGTLRITVESERGIDINSLADWEPSRPRVSRTATAQVLEIELENGA